MSIKNMPKHTVETTEDILTLKDLENGDRTHVKVVMAFFNKTFSYNNSVAGFKDREKNMIAYNMDLYEFLTRQDNNRILEHTLIHEILHQLGLQHTVVPNSEGKMEDSPSGSKISFPNSFMGYEGYRISDYVLKKASEEIVKKYPHCANQNQVIDKLLLNMKYDHEMLPELFDCILTYQNIKDAEEALINKPNNSSKTDNSNEPNKSGDSSVLLAVAIILGVLAGLMLGILCKKYKQQIQEVLCGINQQQQELQVVEQQQQVAGQPQGQQQQNPLDITQIDIELPVVIPIE